MYCKNCGKILNTGDKFCSNCGTKAEPEFVPAFRQPADFTAEAQEEKRPKRTFQTEKFDWDLEGYPTEQKKTEEVNFSWDAVLEEKQRNLFSSGSQYWEHKEPAEERVSDVPEFLKTEDASSELSALEAALFADMGSVENASSAEQTKFAGRTNSKFEKIDKFYTFNKKNEEFQALLDREYERIQSGRSPEEGGKASAESRHEEFDWTLPGDQSFAEFAAPTASELPGGEELQYVGVVFAQPPKCYMAPVQPESARPEIPVSDLAATVPPESAAEAETGEPEIQTQTGHLPPSEGESRAEERQPKEDEKKTESKLTFDDVFGADDDDPYEKPKKGRFLKALAVILLLLVLAELVMIGIQYFAPESAASKAIGRGYEYVIGIFSGEENEPQQEPSATAAVEESEIAGLVEEKADLGKNIAAVSENQALTFEDGKDYGFSDFENAYTFTDKPWYEKDGEKVTYGEEIVAAVIQYYAGWLDKINGKNETVLDLIDDTSELYAEIEALEGEKNVQYGINKLEIGEIRAGGAGFYVLTSAAQVNSDTDKEKQTQQIIYLEPIDKSMKVVDVKEI